MKKSHSKEEKLYFAKILANRMEERAGSDVSMVLKSINTKLAIINEFA